MGDKTGIGWTDATWNPIRGCSRVSAGCVNCYAEQQAARIVRMGKGKPTAYDGLVRLVGGEPRWTGAVRLATDVLSQPLRWTKPRRIFVNSMSDLFHENFTNEQIAAVFGVMAAAPQHTFQILTKRAARMREWFEWVAAQRTPLITIPYSPRLICRSEADKLINPDNTGRPLGTEPSPREWPLPNVWLGVSVEDQAAADERIPELLATPAAVRFLSCEPLIGPVSLRRVRPSPMPIDSLTGSWGVSSNDDAHYKQDPRIDWVIAGCESGPGARPCSVEWLRSLRDQCAAAGTAFFLKQAKVSAENSHDPTDGVVRPALRAGIESNIKPGGVIELPYLDGVQHVAFPEVPRG